MIYDGFTAAVADGIDKTKAGILVDEHFGADILRDAKRGGIITCVPTEQSGQDGFDFEFEFEFGHNFQRHIEAFAPAFCKVLVRYNPECDAAANRRQAARLQRLPEALVGSPSGSLFELLEPATPRQLEALSGEAQTCDRKLRPPVMLRAIGELQDAGVKADVWKVEGLGSQGDLRDAEITREAAVPEIARRYRQWVDVFKQARAAAHSPDAALAPNVVGAPQR